MSIIGKKEAGILMLCAVVIISFLGLILQYAVASICGAVFFAILGLFFLYKPLEGFCMLLFFRINIDMLSSRFHIQIRDDFSLNLAAIFGIAVIVLTAVYCMRDIKERLFLPLSTVPFLLLIIFFGVSVVYSILPFVTLQETLRVVSIFCIFILTASLGKIYGWHAYSKIIYTIIVASLLPLVFAIFQLLTDGGLTDTTGFEGRLFGTFVHPNIFAAFLIIVFGLLLHRIEVIRNSTVRANQTCHAYLCKLLTNEKFLYSMITITAVIFVLTFSRGGWFALLIFLAVYSFLRAPKLLLLTLFIITTLFFTSDLVHDRIEEVYNPPADSSIRWRFQQWQDVIAAWQASPVFGYGAGTEVAIHEREQGFFAGNPYTHNDFLKILQENGVIGVALYALLIVTTFVVLIKKHHATHDGVVKSFILIVTLIFLAEVIFGLSSNIWRGTALQWVLWSLIALALTVEVNHSGHLRKA